MADALIAILIATALASAILGINTHTHRLLSSAKKDLVAAQLARSILLEPPNTAEGTTELGGAEFQWRLKQSAEQHLIRLEVEVSFAGQYSKQTRVYETAVLGGLNGE